MNMPTNDSPLWPILRLAVVGLVLAALLHFGYASGFVPEKDLPTLFWSLLTIGGGEVAQKLLGKKPE